jgi:hypothetical protein
LTEPFFIAAFEVFPGLLCHFDRCKANPFFCVYHKITNLRSFTYTGSRAENCIAARLDCGMLLQVPFRQHVVTILGKNRGVFTFFSKEPQHNLHYNLQGPLEKIKNGWPKNS